VQSCTSHLCWVGILEGMRRDGEESSRTPRLHNRSSHPGIPACVRGRMDLTIGCQFLAYI